MTMKKLFLITCVGLCFSYILGGLDDQENINYIAVIGKIDRISNIAEQYRLEHKELKKEFTTPITNLTVYQGKILMKLINRETSNNCYEIIKEYQGGLTARVYQTVAFFFSSNLKQPYDSKNEDLVIEKIVQEVQRLYGYNEISKSQNL